MFPRTPPLSGGVFIRSFHQHYRLLSQRPFSEEAICYWPDHTFLPSIYLLSASFPNSKHFFSFSLCGNFLCAFQWNHGYQSPSFQLQYRTPSITTLEIVATNGKHEHVDVSGTESNFRAATLCWRYIQLSQCFQKQV